MFRFLGTVQGSNDLPGYIDGTLCYSKNEVLDIFRGWNCEIITETYLQQFKPAKYVNTSIRKMGLQPVRAESSDASVEISREYLIIRAAKARS